MEKQQDTHILNVYDSILIQALNESDFITFLAKDMIMYLLRMTIIGLKHVENNN
jgi:hypothetical protein